jgi:hypothetical protein
MYPVFATPRFIQPSTFNYPYHLYVLNEHHRLPFVISFEDPTKSTADSPSFKIF